MRHVDACHSSPFSAAARSIRRLTISERLGRSFSALRRSSRRAKRLALMRI